jgi:hypothetical protein
MHIPSDDMERRLTEFQVAEDEQGRVVAAIGVQTHERHACIHSEAFEDFSIADEVRPLFLQRIQSLAMNHGVARLWTREQTPFWSQNGFRHAAYETLQKLPEGWDKTQPDWLTLQLRNEEVITSVEKEVAMILQSERRRSAETLRTAKTVKQIFTVVGVLLVLFILAMAAYVLLMRSKISLQPH